MLNTLLNRAINILVHGYYIPVDYYVVDEKKLVYISIPKVACTSIKNAILTTPDPMSQHSDAMDIHHRAERFHRFRLTAEQQKYFKFAFVRSPFDRLVSCYEDKVRRPVQHTGRYYFATRYNTVLLQRLFGGQFHPNMTFGEFVKLVHRIPDRFADGHFRSQYSMLFKNGRPLADFVGKFESLDSDWDRLTATFGFPSLSKRNATARQSWREYYKSPELVELVADRFKDDIREFGYDSDYADLLRASR